MILNRMSLFNEAPIKDMVSSKNKDHGVSHGLSEAGYDLRLKQSIWFIPDGPRGPIVSVDGEPHYGRFVLASAIEEFQMPRDLVGIVHDKSTWARQGLSVFNTVIEPGWNGFLTLELVFNGQKAVHIPAGSGIAQVIFHQTTDKTQYTGKYQNQPDEPVAPKFEGIATQLDNNPMTGNPNEHP